MKNVIALIICILIPQLAGGLGAYFTAESVATWYTQIEKPAFTPPGYLFSIVWPLLFLLMGISSWLIWKKLGQHPLAGWALGVYGIQLILNTLWSFIFFGMQNPGLALVEIIILWAMIAYTMMLFYKVRKAAAYLLIPYILWVSFAIALNASIWWLNL